MYANDNITIGLGALLVLCMVWAGCGQAFSEQRDDSVRGVPVAVVNGEPIMSETFREAYVAYLLKTGLQDKPLYRKHFIESQIVSTLLVQQAREDGVEATDEYKAARDRIYRKLLIDIYVRKALFDSIVVSDDELKDMFVRSNTVLTARHLYAATEQEANALYSRLQQGEDFAALAREVFADSVLANNGGLIGEFTIDDMDVAFEEVAYQLEVGELSTPVRTATGYSIIKLEDRFTKPLITEYEFSERKDRMLQFVLFRKKTKARQDHAAELLDTASPQYNQAAMDHLYDLIVGNPTLQNDEKRAVWMDQELVSFISAKGPVAWAPREFQRLAAETSTEQRARVQSQEDLKTFIDALIVREEMAVRSGEQGLDEDPEFAYELDKAMHNWIWADALEDVVGDAQLTPEMLNTYYEKNQDDFLPPPLVEVSEILVGSRELAAEIKADLKTERFESLARKHSIRPGASEHGGKLGYLRQEQMGVLWQYAANAREGEVIGPIEVDGHYVLLQIGGRKTAEAGAAHPGLDAIKAHYLVQNKDRLVVERVAALRSESDISIDEALLGSLDIKNPVRIP